MAIFYSATSGATHSTGERSGAFFDSALHGDDIPEDAVEISPARHRKLLDAQAEGKEIFADADGHPRFRAPVITAAALRENIANAIRAEAARRIEGISPIHRQLNDQRHPSEAGQRRFEAIDAVREASNFFEDMLAELTAEQLQDFTISQNPLWPEFDPE